MYQEIEYKELRCVKIQTSLPTCLYLAAATISSRKKPRKYEHKPTTEENKNTPNTTKCHESSV
jgi:hypothetical protein